MFSRPQRLRRLALQVLLVWLFALGAGIVNACVVQVQLREAAHAVRRMTTRAWEPPSTRAPVVAADPSSHEHEADSSQPPCKRLCDGPSAAPQTEKQPSNPLSGFWLAAAPLPSFSFQSSIPTGPDRPQHACSLAQGDSHLDRLPAPGLVAPGRPAPVRCRNSPRAIPSPGAQAAYPARILAPSRRRS